jgi:hypothetical protein
MAKAVHCLSQNTPGAGLAGSSWTVKEVGVSDTPSIEGVAQRLCYLLLTDYLG